MKKSRIIPLSLIAALVVSLALIGFPWPSSPAMANFSGRLVYSTADSEAGLSGQVNLFNCSKATADVRLRVTWGSAERVFAVDPVTGAFTGRIIAADAGAAKIEAALEIDGTVVAEGTVVVPATKASSIHIIRFSSAS